MRRLTGFSRQETSKLRRTIPATLVIVALILLIAAVVFAPAWDVAPFSAILSRR
jgi:hypothetical protein